MTDRVGVVVVSHSVDLARAAVALATEMVADDPAPVAVAAGADGGGFGTDATAVMAAIEEVASPAGVLVLMDLGSAVLSAEMALEFLGEPDHPVRLSAAPFTEGLVSAVVQASLGSDLDTVAREADEALAAKVDQLADVDADTTLPDEPAPPDNGGDGGSDPDAIAEVELVNDDGLHARPAARVVQVAGRAAASVTLANVTTGAGPVDAASLSAVARLDARLGHVVAFAARGTDASDVVDELASLVKSGFGETTGKADTDDGRADGADSPPASGAGAAGPTGISPGRGSGAVVRRPPWPDAPSPDARHDGDPEAEVDRLHGASAEVAAALGALADEHDGDVHDILAADAAMARDPGLLDQAERLIREDGAAAPAAMWLAAAEVAEAFTAAGGNLAERRRDVEDVRDRIVAGLRGDTAWQPPPRDEPWVLVADDLAPADAARLVAAGCVAVVLRTGSRDSHTAIIARAHDLPALVVGDDVDDLDDDGLVMVDATDEHLEVGPA